MHYFSQLSYDQEPEYRFAGPTAYSKVLGVARRTNADVVFIDANRIFSRFLISKGFIVLPFIDFVLDVTGTLDSISSRMNRNKKRILRRIDELEYSYETTQDMEKGRFFYNTMYLPYVRARHAESARELSFADFKRHLQQGRLVLVRLKGDYVSGLLCVPNGDELRCLVLGVLDVQKHMSDGAASAPLRFLMSWSKQNGFKKIDYGSTYPFLRDGVLLYKKTLGMWARPLEEKDARVFAIKFSDFRNAREFIAKNPLIFSDSERLIGLVFSDSGIREIYEEYYVPGLSGLIICRSRGDIVDKSPKQEGLKFTQSIGTLMTMASKEGFMFRYLDCSKEIEW